MAAANVADGIRQYEYRQSEREANADYDVAGDLILERRHGAAARDEDEERAADQLGGGGAKEAAQSLVHDDRG